MVKAVLMELLFQSQPKKLLLIMYIKKSMKKLKVLIKRSILYVQGA